MQRMVIESSFRDLLVKAGNPLELCDDTGQRIGYFVPSGELDRSVYGWVRAQLTDDELQRRKEEAGALSTADVLSRLKDG